ncbi:hypothetical protein COO91_00370 [Nostoc flagelliforme CCNUN1]|uniref:Uncharacterized protein n=1 Tax=Nostoc flagelliforme CCNUN1 TaxID=2038116 RepID=A0A2K8SI70_9NOSO|nr:hypothetical protein COO91_00370 [Nostoc flagelliforme CCNUN1]
MSDRGALNIAFSHSPYPYSLFPLIFICSRLDLNAPLSDHEE